MQNRSSLYYTLIVSIGGFLFGFDASVISGAIVYLDTLFELSSLSKGWIVSAPAFSAMFAMLGGGVLSDRIGRKKTLVIALILMGVSSTLIGLLPTYAMIGVTAPILLTSLRFVQGLAIGGQWGGAMLLVTESAPSDKRGYYGAFAQAGAPIGVILANLAFIITSSLVSEESFYSWGWRIPFLASAILIGISMYIQLNLEDTKAFQELQQKRQINDTKENQIKQSPILEAIKKYPNRIALAAGAFLSIQVTFYILIAFLLAYGVSSAEISRDAMLAAVLIASAIMVPSQFMFSSISDRYGRKGIFMAGAILTGLWAYAIFPLVDTGNFYLIVLAITFGLIFVGMMYGPQAAFFTELFTTEVRYSGATLGYQFGAILGGAFAPTIAAFLWNNFGIFWVSVYISFASLLTLLSVMALTETYKTNLNDS